MSHTPHAAPRASGSSSRKGLRSWTWEADERGLLHAAVILVGLYCAVSPWTVDFWLAEPEVARQDLVLGLAIAALTSVALSSARSTSVTDRVVAVLGAWLLVTPWSIGNDAGDSVILNQVCIGAVLFMFSVLRISTAARRT